MKTIGFLLIFFGIAVGMYAFAFDTGVDADSMFGMNKVNNIGLLNDKQNILYVAGVLCIMGSIFFAAAAILEELQRKKESVSSKTE